MRAAPAPPPPAPPPPADPPPLPPLEDENAFEQQQLQDTVFEDSPMDSPMDTPPDSPSGSASEEEALVSGADWQVEP